MGTLFILHRAIETYAGTGAEEALGCCYESPVKRDGAFDTSDTETGREGG